MEKSISNRTLRIDNGLYQNIKSEADKMSISYNAFMMVLLSLGLKVYKGDVVICNNLEREVKP